jgi:parallel beta-helix repeat protein
VCTQNCVIRGNTCSNNGNGAGDGANIHATSNNNRIEGNHCTIADRGIDVDVAGNLIIKNTCSGNTIDWVFAADNVFGPIVNRTTPASAAVSGFAPSSLGVTDGNANFTY